MKLPSIAAVLNSKKDRNGMSPVLVRITYQRKVLFKATGLKGTDKTFRKDKMFYGDENAAYKNRLLWKQIKGYEAAFLKMAENDTLTLENIKTAISDDGGNNQSVSEILQKVIDKYQFVHHRNYIRVWESARNKLIVFKPELSIDGLDAALMNAFQSHMVKKLKNEFNTVAGTLRRIKTMIGNARKLGLITEDPLRDYSAPAYKQTHRAYLTEEQIKQFVEFCNTTKNKYLQNVAAWFVLGCYSGLRYSDIVNWNEEKMVKGERLYFSDEKTKTPHYIPIYPELSESIKSVREIRRIPENQVCNRALKEIAGILELEENVTFHMARHSFAVMFLDRGGSIEVLQALMGHKKIATTQIYGKITSKRIDDETKRIFGTSN